MPLAHVMMSGSSPKRFEANQSPHAPEPRDDLVGDEQHVRRRDTPRAPPGGSPAGGGTRRRRRSPVRRRTPPRAPGRHARSRRGAASASSHGTSMTSSIKLPVPGGVRGDAGQRRPGRVHPVIGLLAPDQDRALRLLADELPVAARHLRGGVDRVGAAAREEHLRARHRGERGHAVGEASARSGS